MIPSLGFILVPSISFSLPSYQTDSSNNAFSVIHCGKACAECEQCGGFYWNQQEVGIKIRGNVEKIFIEFITQFFSVSNLKSNNTLYEPSDVRSFWGSCDATRRKIVHYITAWGKYFTYTFTSCTTVSPSSQTVLDEIIQANSS